ncbi:MAG: bifunctional (p)ppGpp synthetase/guanosine-3',5'-bis(diphosphate) 3'-pyrophosphohydrolase [Desulfobulbaceae bacterium]|uniref:Bifunctional (P)ppGpp synthetase/guanosine-3',5'-bis(Diphosphate) 3'-pyrophosphohydrolase n=1 Tax=Candidatus Desulfobia pelagia TaxID=2841692 RepID=A0A8J6NFW5_9BACT|nr:bifunctional (p)ppGpp synthetase/guanosine-3',5'-bis(diphosphate) 3'-pyrophosphohydrolase [Candidatus Desulfobia pelagia]
MTSNTFDISAYCKRMEGLIGGQEGPAALFWKAFSFAVDAHQDQKRKSGEVYVSHPCHVVLILVEELGVTDPAMLAAAILHDTVEDVKEVTPSLIGEMFGKHVAAIVDGCTKIDDFSGDRQSLYKVIHRKIFTKAASRVEVMLVKLADRLHNMRTMAAMPKHKRQKVADETLDVYAPLAEVMGLYGLKRELYGLALMNKFPRQSLKVAASIRQLEEQDLVVGIRQQLQEAFEDVWITARIRIRAKGLGAYYDTVLKVLSKNIEDPLDIIVIVDDVQSCYRVLGVINNLFPPIPRTIRDFIANPKPTGYQSLHAKANIKGQNFLFKIRTQEMMDSAKNGIIQQWLTLRTIPSVFANEIKEMLGILGSDDELSYREMIAASGARDIYTYTPRGDLISLPAKSIVLDFAFKVHTEIGLHCIAATVGQEKVGMDHVLKDGDRVVIITQERPVRFDPEIQKSCRSPRARSELSRLFRMRRHNLARRVGQSLIRQELRQYGVSFSIVDQKEFMNVVTFFGREDIDDLYLAVGQGEIRLKEFLGAIKKFLFANKPPLWPKPEFLNRIYLDTLDQACIKLSRCCHPIPSDKGLLALLSDRGLSVHHQDCNRLKQLKIQREDVVEVRWNLKNTSIEKLQDVFINEKYSRNRVFMLLSVAPEDMKVVDVVALSSVPSNITAWDISFDVENLQGLKNILQHFRKSKLDFEFVLEQ